jgi:hypothetical protein
MPAKLVSLLHFCFFCAKPVFTRSLQALLDRSIPPIHGIRNQPSQETFSTEANEDSEGIPIQNRDFVLFVAFCSRILDPQLAAPNRIDHGLPDLDPVKPGQTQSNHSSTLNMYEDYETTRLQDLRLIKANYS